jgi:hypothetical protein
VDLIEKKKHPSSSCFGQEINPPKLILCGIATWVGMAEATSRRRGGRDLVRQPAPELNEERATQNRQGSGLI